VEEMLHVLFDLAVSSACGPGQIFSESAMLSRMERDDFFRVQRRR